MRRWRLGFILSAFMVVVSGSIMTGLHGFSFFVFRSAGTGQTPASALKENQGPGQPDAPLPIFLLSAITPDGSEITIRSHINLTWAGIAKMHNGTWKVLADGTAYRQVVRSTCHSYAAHSSLYQSKWAIVSVENEQND